MRFEMTVNMSCHCFGKSLATACGVPISKDIWRKRHLGLSVSEFAQSCEQYLEYLFGNEVGQLLVDQGLYTRSAAAMFELWFVLTFSAVPNTTIPSGLVTGSYRFFAPGANLQGRSSRAAFRAARCESISAALAG
jgi:hypothetical protein